VAGKSTKVQVQYQGVASNTMTIPVQATTPGSSRWMPAASVRARFFNQDNKVNSSQTRQPAAPLWHLLTGAGVTTPASAMAP